MIHLIRGYSVETNPTRNLAIRQQIAAFIEGRRSAPPPCFVSKGGQIPLCTLSDGRKISLPTSYRKELPLIVAVVAENNRILARVFPREPNYRPAEEKFLLKENGAVLAEARKVVAEQPAGNGEESQEARVINRKIISWWKGKTDEIPGDFVRKVNNFGSVSLCRFDQQNINLPLGIAYHHQMAAVKFSWDRASGSKWLTVTVGDIRKTFILVRNGEMYTRPMLKLGGE